MHLLSVDGTRSEILAQRIPQAVGTMLAWSPDSKMIACISAESEYGSVHILFLDGHSTSFEGQENLCLGNREGYPPLWSRDGDKLYCWAKGGVQEIDRGNGEIRSVTETLEGYYVFGIFHSLGSGTASDFGEPGSIVIMARDTTTLQEGLYRIGNGNPTCVVQDRDRSLVRFLLYGDNQLDWCIGQIEDPANPPNLFAVNVRSGEEKRIALLNSVSESSGSIQTVLLQYPGPQKRNLRGALFLPPGHQPGEISCSDR